jgi:hypothetical protein
MFVEMITYVDLAERLKVSPEAARGACETASAAPITIE